MFPAQALAEVMLARGWRVKLSTDDRGARYAGGFPAAVKVEKVASATFARGGALAKLLVPWIGDSRRTSPWNSRCRTTRSAAASIRRVVDSER